MIRKRPVLFIILIIFFSMEVSSCSTQRSVLINSLPNDNSWFTRAKRIALVQGREEAGLYYIWFSKTIYINAEQVYYITTYWPGFKSGLKMLTLHKKHGSLSRTLYILRIKTSIW